MKTFISLLICLVFVSCANHSKEHKTVNTSMNDKFLKDDLDVKLWQERFENRDRDVYKNKEKIVNALDIQPGQAIADVGAGTGFYLKLLHEKVGEDGFVNAVEISPGFVKFLKARGEKENLSNLVVYKGGLDSTKLPYNSQDKIFVCDTYHHFDKPQKMLNDFWRVLKTGGELVIVDFDKIPGKSRKWILNHIKKTKAQYIKEISANGFEFVKESKINLEENFMLHFRKK